MPTMALLMFSCFLLLTSFPVAETRSARILLVPTDFNSHIAYFTHLGIELARLGHVVQVLAPSNGLTSAAVQSYEGDFALANNKTLNYGNFSYVTYPVDGDTSYSNSPEGSAAAFQMALSKSLLGKFSSFLKFMGNISREQELNYAQLMANDQLLEQIRSTGFDFAIMDPVYAHSYALPYSMNIPYASLSVGYVGSLYYRVPRLPSFVSLFIHSDRMTFGQRMINFLIEFCRIVTEDSSTHFVKKYAPNRLPLSAAELLQQASLWLFLEDTAAGFAMPQMPNTVAVGDLMGGRPGRPLSSDLEEFIRQSPDGVVVVSFGSSFDFVPETVVLSLCEALGDLHSRLGLRIVWKLRETLLPNSCGVHQVRTNDFITVRQWIPQNDLLADNRVRLFVSHGGLNSIIESVYHAKPLIIFPIALDQPLNGAIATSKGYAICMDLANYTAKQFVDNVVRILQSDDQSFRLNAKLASKILRDKPDSPAERVSRMIEHVIKYGDRHLRSGAFDLNMFQFFMFDTFVAVLVIALVLVIAIVVACCTLCRCIPSRQRNLQTKYKND